MYVCVCVCMYANNNDPTFTTATGPTQDNIKVTYILYVSRKQTKNNPNKMPQTVTTSIQTTPMYTRSCTLSNLKTKVKSKANTTCWGYRMMPSNVSH
jgi:hypothetical protein